LSNRASSIIPIPGIIAADELVPLVNERLLRVDQELGRLDTRINSIPATTAPVATVEANSVKQAVCTAAFACGAGYATITGMTLTLDRAGVWVITGVIRGVINAAAALLVGQLLVTPLVGAPAALTPNILLQGANAHQATVSQTWIHTAALSDQIALQAVGVNTGVDPVTAGVGKSSTLTAIWISP
jgi:hypothetical protein